MPFFQRLLIANRGEIACRIMKTASRMGLTTLAVYSEADKYARHVAEADEAYYLGASPAKESYLSIDKLIALAKTTHAEAIHPGYGFLSESPEFALACEAAGLVFVGPPAPAMRAMGNKSHAKALMAKANVPLIPGYHGEDQSLDTFLKAATTMGYPVLLKAAAGGGGKGMRIVQTAKDLPEAFDSAKREALSSFNDDRLLIEKYLQHPRHIEVQIFADTHGQQVYLHERDCSIQRRHQKIIEEAPAAFLSRDLREKMGQAAVACAQAIDYVGAGTIEFLLDRHEQFYFMEMNTRLQVEHPVTEMITGLDLVEWQIRIAAGELLPLTQRDIPAFGHAIEARIYAEDPAHGFLPSIGQPTYLHTPPQTAFTRIDSGIRLGDQITAYYDPMIAKLIVWGKDRIQACARLTQALAAYRIAGVKTNISFLHQISTNTAYLDGQLATDFIETHQDSLFPVLSIEDVADLLIACVLSQHMTRLKTYQEQSPSSPWLNAGDRRFLLTHEQTYDLVWQDQVYTIGLETIDNTVNVRFLTEQKTPVSVIPGPDHSLLLIMDGNQKTYHVIPKAQGYTVFQNGRQIDLSLPVLPWRIHEETGAGYSLCSPMPGTIILTHVEAKQAVKKGDPLMIIEAMKMEHTIRAPKDGIIDILRYATGDIVEEGAQVIMMAE